MFMENKYIERAKFEDYVPFYGDAPHEKIISGKAHPIEGTVFLNIRNKRLECFVCDSESLDGFLKIKPGEIVQVKMLFHNFPYKDDTRTKERKYIEDIRMEKHRTGGVNHYRIAGQIIEIGKHPKYEDSYKIIIDCGLILTTRIGKNVPVKVGDYIRAEGRLDAHLVEGDSK